MPDPRSTSDTSPRFTAFATACVEHGRTKIFRSAGASSAESQADAQRLAHNLARERAAAAATGRPTLTPAGTYPYPERVLIEPVLERLLLPDSPEAREIARVTRNSYHAEVINAYRVMFVDVDTLPDSTNSPAEKPVPQAEALQALFDLVAQRPELRFRVYSTKAGLRYLCTSRLFDPLSAESRDILLRLKADTRYAQLCRVQKCYRARVSPKPWRCLSKPERSGFFRRLFNGVGDVIAPESFATCRYLESVGDNPEMPPEVSLVLQKHDTACEVTSTKPLA